MLTFDIETDGLLDTMTTIHCMVISDGINKWEFRPSEIPEGVRMLHEGILNGQQICGHNIIDFDIQAINKIYPYFIIPRDKRHLVVDTLVLSKLIYSNIADWDIILMRKGILPGKLFGKHSLESWGYRLGKLKGTYGKQENAWEKFTEEMLDYNGLDVEVTEVLYEKLMEKCYSGKAIQLEHEVQWLMTQQQANGFPFNKTKAEALELTLRGRAAVLDAEIRKYVPMVPDKVFIPKRDNKTKGYIAGVPIQRYKDFNPNSRQQIEWLITKHYEYQPLEHGLYDLEGYKKSCPDATEDEITDYISKGEARLKINDETFEFLKDDLKAPEEVRTIAKPIAESLMISKRLGMLADGKNAWFKCLGSDGYVHGSVNALGAVTGRATHSCPNMAQVPKVGSPYGHECRELFEVPRGWVQVGVDASGLELRCLGHFMAPYDNGQYAHEVINGDIHTLNQKAAGLPTRNDAKTFIYAFLYGAGDLLIGQQVGGGSKEGRKVKKEFLAKTPALSSFRKAVENVLVDKVSKGGRVLKWKRKYLKGLDGRLLYVRSVHSAVNLLLQSAGALICKKWICRWEERLVNRGLTHGWNGDFAFMAWVHKQSLCTINQVNSVKAL